MEIRSLWAARLMTSLRAKAMLTVLGLRREHVTTLIEEFPLPAPPGQMWRALRDPQRGSSKWGFI